MATENQRKGIEFTMKNLPSYLRPVSFSLILALSVCGQTAKQDVPPTSATASPDGRRIVIKPDGLPAPYHTESVQNQPRVITQPEGARLELPQGFEISVFSEDDYRNPRWIIEGPNGDLFLTDSAQGVHTIFLLRDANKDGKIDNATERFTFATGLN